MLPLAPRHRQLALDALLWLEDGKRAFGAPIANVGMLICASEPNADSGLGCAVEPLCTLEFC